MGDPEHEPRMEPRRGRVQHRVIQGLVAAGLIVAGVAGGVLWSERRAASDRSGSAADATRAAGTSEDARKTAPPMPGMPGMPGMASPSTAGAGKADDAVEVSLTPEGVERAGIKTAVVRSEPARTAVTVPGTVTSNAYRDTKVNGLVGGIVRQVVVELGAMTRRGQPLAVIFSSELADAQMRYLSMRAMFEADHQKLERTEKLVRLGAASRQELEEVQAIHTGHETEVAAARQRLILLGLSPAGVDRLTDPAHVVSEVTVTAPADGVVIARSVNPGQVVGASQELFVVTDLSTVWVIGDLYEKDFAAVKVGTDAVVSIPAAPSSTLRGRVTYIDPRVDPATRTAKVRVEVPNPGGNLRLGMYANVSFETVTGRRTLIPRTAVQTLGERTVVYVPKPDADGQFVERPVKLGEPVGTDVEVREGVKPGERVVTEGSFFLRAEAGRTRAGS